MNLKNQLDRFARVNMRAFTCVSSLRSRKKSVHSKSKPWQVPPKKFPLRPKFAPTCSAKFATTPGQPWTTLDKTVIFHQKPGQF